MGYDSYSYLFFGLELEDIRDDNNYFDWDRYDKLQARRGQDSPIAVIRTGCQASGNHQHLYVYCPQSYRDIQESKYDVRAPINVSWLGAELAPVLLDFYNIMPTYLAIHNLKLLNPDDPYGAWIVASSGS